MTSEAILASIDRHFRLFDQLDTDQLGEHEVRGSCTSCELVAIAEQNSRWVAAGRPMRAGHPLKV